MLLKHLSDFAHSRGLLEDLAFAPKAVRWIIPLDANGRLVGHGPRESAGEKNRGMEYPAPRTSRAKDAGGVAEFLADGLTAIFGLDSKPDEQLTEKQRKDRDKNNARKHEEFWQHIERAYETTNHSGLGAVLEFYKSIGGAADFLRWGKSADADADEKNSWWIRTASGNEVRLGPDNFTFEVDGELLLLDESQMRPYWRRVYAEEIANKEAEAARGLCLVTGAEDVPIAATHLPKIKRVPNTRAFGAAIVSFDKPAFASYGFDKSYNAPVSTEAVAAYCNALNWLMNRDDHSLRIGQTALCFWAAQTEEASSFFARMLNRPDPQSVAQFIKAPWAGIDRNLAKSENFFSVTLAGNAGRVVVRHWMQTTVETARENFRRWFEDLSILEIGDPTARAKRWKQKAEAGDAEEMPPLALFRLACATVREAKDLQPEVPAQLYRAALERTAPSPRLLKPLLNRLDADLVRFGPKTLLNMSRFALLKLILNRNRKENEPMMQPEVCDTDDPAYNSGRLLAILSDTQQKAHEYKLEGAGVAERYFGTASVSPASVFPLLLRLNRHHLKKISKSDRFAGHERFIEDAIQNVLVRFKCPEPGQPPMFPRTLDLHAQGRFALGFYQQKASDDAARRSNPNKNETPKEDKSNE